MNEYELRRLMDAVRDSFRVAAFEVPDAFFPGHASVALIDAVFGVRPWREKHAPETVTQRYCRQFGLEHPRKDRLNAPPANAQETLDGLIEHYERLGPRVMEEEVFSTRCRFPGTGLSRVRYVARAAAAFRSVGVNVLQDIAHRSPRTIHDALGGLPGDATDVWRGLVIHAGDDGFVLGESGVCAFVARTTGRKSVSAARAVDLVRCCAHELRISPRYLYARISSLHGRGSCDFSEPGSGTSSVALDRHGN